MKRNCSYCGKETDNPKYCSRSCSASASNKAVPKRKRTTKCSKDGCNILTKSYRHRLCEQHHEEHQDHMKNSFKFYTVGEYRNRLSVKGKHPSWANSHVRNFARSWLPHLRELPCKNCGYSLHVELCHIHPVSEFPDSALLGEINKEDNVIQLCRNCHWELDNGHLDIGDINK